MMVKRKQVRADHPGRRSPAVGRAKVEWGENAGWQDKLRASHRLDSPWDFTVDCRPVRRIFKAYMIKSSRSPRPPRIDRVDHVSVVGAIISLVAHD